MCGVCRRTEPQGSKVAGGMKVGPWEHHNVDAFAQSEEAGIRDAACAMQLTRRQPDHRARGWPESRLERAEMVCDSILTFIYWQDSRCFNKTE